MTAHEQLSYSVHHAEQQIEQRKKQPDANQATIDSQERELQILRRKLELQPE